MPTITLSTLLGVLLLASACSYTSAAPWRRSVCHSMPPGSEREACLEQAARSEKDYREDVEAVSDNPGN